MTAWAIRGFRPTDARRLTEINPTFVSPATLRVHKTGTGLEVCWRLEEVPLSEPYDKGAAYDLTPEDVEEISERGGSGDSLVLVAEAEARLVGLYDLDVTDWNNTGWLWNLLVDVNWRGRGLGRELFQRGLAWARKRNLRAIFIETQTNNVPACRFYHHMGCHLVSVHDEYYTNHDIDAGEVAVLWGYNLSDTAPDAFAERE